MALFGAKTPSTQVLAFSQGVGAQIARQATVLIRKKTAVVCGYTTFEEAEFL